MNRFDKDYLKDYISNNKVEALIKELSSRISAYNNPELNKVKDTLVIISRRLKQIEEESIKGTINPKDAKVEINKISDSLISIINILPDDFYDFHNRNHKGSPSDEINQQAFRLNSFNRNTIVEIEEKFRKDFKEHKDLLVELDKANFLKERNKAKELEQTDTKTIQTNTLSPIQEKRKSTDNHYNVYLLTFIITIILIFIHYEIGLFFGIINILVGMNAFRYSVINETYSMYKLLGLSSLLVGGLIFAGLWYEYLDDSFTKYTVVVYSIILIFIIISKSPSANE